MAGRQGKPSKFEIDISAPGFICTAYPLVVLTAILIFRLFFPYAEIYGGEAPRYMQTPVIGVFRVGNSLTHGILDFISFFPAIFMSAQLIPFRRAPTQKSVRYQRFSPEFLSLLRPQLIASVAATIIYSLLSLIVRPICADYQVDIRTKSILYNEAKEKILLFSNKENWVEASNFLLLCERIWPGSNELASSREIVDTNLTRIVYNRGGVQEKDTSRGIIPGQSVPVDVQSALRLAETALREERYYDGHRLAAIAERLAPAGSNELERAFRLETAAWQAIESLEPDTTELGQYAIYRQKRDGYEAMHSGDWIRAYYIFRNLTTQAPNDPDINKFLINCTEELAQAAFFIDEMNIRLGAEFAGTVFSLPLFNMEGRLVMRLASLSTTVDYSYGNTLEIDAFDAAQKPIYKIEAPYVKFAPLYIGERQLTVVYLRALSRDFEQMRWGPVWYGSPPEGTPPNQFVLAISYENFLLASVAGKNLDGFFLSDIRSIADNLEPYGYVPEVYRAQIINNIVEPMLFLPLMIFTLVLGWTLRCKKRVSFAIYPMFIALPIVLNGLILIFRSISTIFSVFAVLSFGFTAALLLSFASAFILFVLGVVILAFQRTYHYPPPPPHRTR
ncbi:MAG: hypothetical protein LBF80_05060 [Spirochaetaceae bacterium]|jgi:hypothetical protein|nr:hypothetical protein [Spirochaetaceae bacterium]